MAGTVGIDVDAYGEKIGEQVFKRALDELGPLPPTWTSTSRGEGPSRIYFFRVPFGTRLDKAQRRIADRWGEKRERGGKLIQVSDVDIIHQGHRYAVVWPSVHPDTGCVYEWFEPDGSYPGPVPPRMELPYLPTPWLEFLALSDEETPSSDLGGTTAPSAPQGEHEDHGPRVQGEYEDHGPRVNESPMPADPDFDLPSRLFTMDQAKAFVSAELKAFRNMRTPEDSGFNNALNALACTYSHFVPEFLTAEIAERVIYEAAVYNRSVEWQGEGQVRATIRSGLNQRSDPWKAVQGGTGAFGETEPRLPEERPAKERLQVYDINDLASIPRPKPLLKGLLDVGTIAVLAGKFGTYKTFVALSWACHIASGQEWGGYEVPEARPVLYVYAEGAGGAHARYQAWASVHGAVPAGKLFLIPRPVRIPSDDDMIFMGELIEEHKAGLVVFDTLRKSAGDADLDTSKDSAPIIDRMAALRDEYGVTCLATHHTGHAGERARGSSLLEDDADASFVIRLSGDQEDRGIGNQRVLHHRKSKDGRLAEPLPLKFNPVVIPETDSYPEVDSGYVTVDPFGLAAISGAARAKTKSVPPERLIALSKEADAVPLAPEAGRSTILEAFRHLGKTITEDEARALAKYRKSMIPQDSDEFD